MPTTPGFPDAPGEKQVIWEMLTSLLFLTVEGDQLHLCMEGPTDDEPDRHVMLLVEEAERVAAAIMKGVAQARKAHAKTDRNAPRIVGWQSPRRKPKQANSEPEKKSTIAEAEKLRGKQEALF